MVSAASESLLAVEPGDRTTPGQLGTVGGPLLGTLAPHRDGP